MERTKFPNKQNVALRYCELGEIENTLHDYVKKHDQLGGEPYFLHIDHFQVLPVNKNGLYPILFTFHKVYLDRT